MSKKKASALLVAGFAAGLGASSIVPTLIGGSEAPEGKYPATVRIFAGGSCTATLIGPKVLLTAAHCVSSGGTVSFKHKGSNLKSQPCSHHSAYPGNKTADFALCEVSTTEGPWESLNTNHSLVSKGDRIRLTGYGCTNPGGGGGNDGILREGYAKVTRIPSKSNFDIVTTADKGALCFGDSGGPAFIEQGSQRVLVGVNSRGDIARTSYLSAVHMADQNFIKKWADGKGLKICGLHTLEGCQAGLEKPKPPKEDEGFSLESFLEILKKLLVLLEEFFK